MTHDSNRMIALSQLAEAGRKYTEQTHRSYRGYSVVKSPFDHLWRVSKDGFTIFTAETFDAARSAIDGVA